MESLSAKDSAVCESTPTHSQSMLSCDSGLLLEGGSLSNSADFPVEPTNHKSYPNLNISKESPMAELRNNSSARQVSTDQNDCNTGVDELHIVEDASSLSQQYFIEPVSLTSIPVVMEAGNMKNESMVLPVKLLPQGQQYQDVCRICAYENERLLPLFFGEGLSLSLVEKIHSCLPIKVSDNDGLPQQICESCSSKLQICHDLIKLSIAGNAKLVAMSMPWPSVEEQLEQIEISNACVEKTEAECQDAGKKGAQGYEKPDSKNEKEQNDELLVCLIDIKAANALESHDSRADNKERLWNCSECDYIASRKSSLTLHKRFKHNHNKNVVMKGKVNETQQELVAKFLCGYCDKSFPSEMKREKHMQSHTRLAKQRLRDVCSLCCEEFSSTKSLRDHLKNIHNVKNERKYSCDKCDKSYSVRGSLDIHRATHSNETPFLCDICGKSFKHASNLRCHKRSHADGKITHPHACDICPKSFSSKFHLSEHKNVHRDITPYACGVCDKKFHRKIQLRQHRLVHKKDSVYECPQCGVSFNRRGNMTQHMKRHLKERKFICKVCKESFPTLSEVVQHRRKHTPQELFDHCKEKKIHPCSLCCKSFPSSILLDEHRKVHSDTQFQCALCNKRLSNRRTLDYHIRSFHTGERPFPCQYCSESFLSRESRTVHERLHTGEKPYTCQTCQMSFRCLSNLTQHISTHRDDRPWACDHCPKRFKRKGILLVHMRTHTGEKPYCCDICGRRFTQKNDMLKHQQTHKTAKQTYVCFNCNWPFPSRKELNKHLQTHCNDQNVAVVETVSNCITPVVQASQPQTLVITDELCQFPITILEDGSNVIHIEDIQKLTQHSGVNPGEPNSQIVEFNDSMFHAVVTEPQVLQLQPAGEINSGGSSW